MAASGYFLPAVLVNKKIDGLSPPLHREAK